METKIIEIIDRLLSDPMKALVVGSSVVAFFVVRKYSQLQEKAFKQFEDHRSDLKSAGLSLTHDMKTAKDDIFQLRADLIAQTQAMREEMAVLSGKLSRYMLEMDLSREESAKVRELEKDLKETNGRVIFIEDKIRASDSRLDKTREQLRDAVLILQKHKDKISKL